MKICLVNPKTNVLISDTVMPPLGLWYVSAALQEDGHEVYVYDMAHDSPNDVLMDWLGIYVKADAYGITGTTPQAGKMREIIERVRTIQPSAKIVVGGPHATLMAEEILEEWGCDIVVRGEIEEQARSLAGHIAADWRGIISPRRIEDLDSVPFPDRRQARCYTYEIDGLPATMMITSRGCPYRCAFCSRPLGRYVRMQSVERILAEIREIRDRHGYQAIYFMDDTMGIDSARLMRLCEGMASLGMTWRCFLRGDQVTHDIAWALRAGGCVEVGIGVESGSDRILENIHKGEPVWMIEAGIRTLQEAGVRVKGFFIVGLPGEDPESLAETEAFLERVPLDDVDFTIFSAYPGSPIYDAPKDYDVQWENTTATYYKADPEKYACAVRTTALAGWELLNARRHLEKRFKKWK